MRPFFCRRCGLPWPKPYFCSTCGPVQEHGELHHFCEHCGTPLSGHTCEGPIKEGKAFLEMEGVKVASGSLEAMSSYFARHHELGTSAVKLFRWTERGWTEVHQS